MPDKSSDTMKRTLRAKRRKPSREQKKTQTTVNRKAVPHAGLSAMQNLKGRPRNKG